MLTSFLQTCSMISYSFIMVFSGSRRLFRTSSGMVKQMEEDKLRFGAAAWASAAPRLEKLRFVLAKETLQHMRTTEMCLNRKQDSIREKVPVVFYLLYKLIPQSVSCLCHYSAPILYWQFRHWRDYIVVIKPLFLTSWPALLLHQLSFGM